LVSMPRLHTLYLNDKITDKGLAALGRLTPLRALDLTGCPVSGEGLASLGGLKNLRELALSQTRVDDKGLAHVTKLPRLRVLELSDTAVTSKGLAQLKALKSLEVLSLSWAKLTPEQVQDMTAVAHLKTIILNGAPLSRSLMTRLRDLAHAPPPSVHTVALGQAVPVSATGVVAPQRLEPKSFKAIPEPPSSSPVRGQVRGQVLRSNSVAVQDLTPVVRRTPEMAHVSIDSQKTISVSAKPVTAESLTTQLILHSKEIPRSPLSGLKRVHEVETQQAFLMDVIPASRTPGIELREDKPENSLGEITVGAEHR
jgi:Leucine-rich repeat (LRR) protein